MLRLILVLVFAAGLVACATSPNVDSLYDRDADFSQYKTFAFAETQSESTGKYTSLLDKFLKSAISRELLARGYVRSDKPDLLVNYHISSKEKTDVYDVHRPSFSYYHYRYAYGYSPWPHYGTELRVRKYTEGTLNIDLVDTGKKQLVWEGITVGRIRNESLANLEGRINAAVKLVFDRYPFRAGDGTPILPESE
jgi:hypothetical protein